MHKRNKYVSYWNKNPNFDAFYKLMLYELSMGFAKNIATRLEC